MNIYNTYKKEVRNITGRYFKKYKHKVYSYEDLEQTVWYILLAGMEKFDGGYDLRSLQLSFIEYKIG